MNRLSVKMTTLALAALLGALAAPQAVHAQVSIPNIRKGLRQFDQERLKVMSNSPRPGKDYTKVYLKNETRKPIRVAILYFPYQAPSSTSESELKSLEARRDPWQLAAWYNLAPGERAHVANTDNLNFYTYAEYQDGAGGVWSGNSVTRTVEGRSLGFRVNLLVTAYEENNIRFSR